ADRTKPERGSAARGISGVRDAREGDTEGLALNRDSPSLCCVQKFALRGTRACSAAVYRIFQRADGAAPSVRTVVLALVIAAALATAIGVIRVGFELSRRSEQLGRLHEARRQLELELATLAAPDRIRRLATQLGMTPVSPDRIRVVARHVRAAQVGAPAGERMP